MKTLSQCLRALYEAVECTQLEEFDGHKKSEWMVFVQECINVAVTIEENFGLPDLAKKNEALEAELEAIKQSRESDKSDSAAQIDVLSKELDTLRAEQKKREEAEKDLWPEQFTILKIVPPEAIAKHCDLSDIHGKTKMSIGDVGVHVARLKKDGYIKEWQLGYYRTDKGHRYLMAKRLAGESGEDRAAWLEVLKVLNGAHSGLQPSQIARSLKTTQFDIDFLLCELENEAFAAGVWDHGYFMSSFKIIRGGSRYLADNVSGQERQILSEEKKRKFADLDPINERILMILKKGGFPEDGILSALRNDGHRMTPEKCRHILNGMKRDKWISYNPEEPTYGAPVMWFILENGTEYLDERGKL